MRVAIYNIHGWRTGNGAPNLEAVTRVLAAVGADIVGLNEVFYPRAVPLRAGLAPAGSALEVLAEGLGMHFAFGPCVRWPAQAQAPADAYGNALLSRWPILASAAHHLTPVAGKEQRGLLEARILLPNRRPLTVYVTHLDHTDEEARLVQLRALRTWTVRDRNRPHLVMGDFNAIHPWDFAGRPEALAQLGRNPKGSHMAQTARDGPQVIPQMEKAGYVDAYTRFGPPGAQSFIPAVDPPVRIDYIFVSGPLLPALTGCAIWQEPPGQEASDHRPVVADFDLEKVSVHE
ncbi:MAG TPA: endonuclease/exonuclease/phosphatase family protein [Caldilineaceae bacterium]|nr:endonuclease/exonuclease/phosphatase family protein [Caldilineaceae bacterium]